MSVSGPKYIVGLYWVINSLRVFYGFAPLLRSLYIIRDSIEWCASPSSPTLTYFFFFFPNSHQALAQQTSHVVQARYRDFSIHDLDSCLWCFDLCQWLEGLKDIIYDSANSFSLMKQEERRNLWSSQRLIRRNTMRWLYSILTFFVNWEKSVHLGSCLYWIGLVRPCIAFRIYGLILQLNLKALILLRSI